MQWWQVLVVFVGAPLGLFAAISAVVWVATKPSASTPSLAGSGLGPPAPDPEVHDEGPSTSPARGPDSRSDSVGDDLQPDVVADEGSVE